MSLTRRLQVLVDEERYAALERESQRTGRSVGAVVRAAIDEQLAPAGRHRDGAGRRLLEAPPTPVGEPEELAAEIALLAERWPPGVSRFLIDSNVVLYALGAEHRYREPCRRLVALADEGRLRPEASVELVKEVVWVRSRRLDRRQALRDGRDVAALCVRHALEPADLEVALGLLETHPAMGPRDAAHAATALGRGIGQLVSADRHLDGIDGLRRIDPVDVAAVEALL